jgi:2-oxoglutarate ferredoxin oxidoreductase subunit gamma
MKELRILIAGEGGQGVQLVAKLLIEASFKKRKQITYLPNFGVEQRGGVSLAFIQISDLPISFPKFQKADIIILLTKRGLARVERYFTPETVLIFDNSIVSEEDVRSLKVEKIAVPASHIAKTKLVPRVFNIIILGVIGHYLGLKLKEIQFEMLKFFKLKYEAEPELKHFNQKALEIGYETMKGLVSK